MEPADNAAALVMGHESPHGLAWKNAMSASFSASAVPLHRFFSALLLHAVTADNTLLHSFLSKLM